ncbi:MULTISPECIES: hypothetical protein [unclassified Nocardioides]|uniref:hypothetical protein n=1 Tax=unclassified Nocardioides TaxID=2615069 RepID=UPI0007039F58|nr:MULTISPECIES: hypothetical protein [unclassified Nocardioides]KRC48825.1 hypothetical protein ASE19_18065 [Nocardioides sp. Root79]KRC75224.1 hypothetical protein ASE20_19965 [Nocardioides sp. Root240]
MDFLEWAAGRPFTTATAREHGVTRGQLRTWLADGVVRRMLIGVYVDATAPDTIELRVAAVSCVMAPHAVLCDRTAAWLHGVDVFELAEHDVLPAIDVVSEAGGNASTRSHVFGGERDLLPSEIMTVRGVRVTTPIRTACDLACLKGRWRAIAVLDAFRRAHGITMLDLTLMLPRYRRRRGCRQLRELIPLSTDEADSPPESWIRLIIHDAGLPVPAAQVWVRLPDGRRFKIENAYAALRIGVEYDGEENHTSDDDVEHDDDRRGHLVDVEDWIILVITKRDLGPREREAWLAELEEAIARRCPERPAKRVYARGPDDPSYRWRRRRRR